MIQITAILQQKIPQNRNDGERENVKIQTFTWRHLLENKYVFIYK